MKRRSFLRAASAGSLVGSALGNLAYAQRVTANQPAEFKTAEVEVGGNKIFLRRYGIGPPILMVHGFPRTSLMWRFLAPKLAANHTVVCVDLRAYGRSAIPASTDNHFPYSKRAMARELVDVMDQLGFRSFRFDLPRSWRTRGVSMALDHPKNVERLAVFDVIPILEAWTSDARFAQTYWPWILLSQKEPLPESYLLGAPEAVFHNPFGQGSFGPEILAEYVSTYRDPARVHGSVRSIEPRRPSTLNMIARTRRLPNGSNARCCIYGPRAVRLTLSTQRTADRWAYGVSGLRLLRAGR
jgi:pimeloyl-ACP methyl ester carboxylesterase